MFRNIAKLLTSSCQQLVCTACTFRDKSKFDWISYDAKTLLLVVKLVLLIQYLAFLRILKPYRNETVLIAFFKSYAWMVYPIFINFIGQTFIQITTIQCYFRPYVSMRLLLRFLQLGKNNL